MSHPCDDAFDQSWLDLVWPDTLGRNLAVAGALCAAYWTGYSECCKVRIRTARRDRWRPGCGREVPR